MLDLKKHLQKFERFGIFGTLYPSGNLNIPMENDPFIDDLSWFTYKTLWFSIPMLVYWRDLEGM